MNQEQWIDKINAISQFLLSGESQLHPAVIHTALRFIAACKPQNGCLSWVQTELVGWFEGVIRYCRTHHNRITTTHNVTDHSCVIVFMLVQPWASESFCPEGALSQWLVIHGLELKSLLIPADLWWFYDVLAAPYVADCLTRRLTNALYYYRPGRLTVSDRNHHLLLDRMLKHWITPPMACNLSAMTSAFPARSQAMFSDVAVAEMCPHYVCLYGVF